MHSISLLEGERTESHATFSMQFPTAMLQMFHLAAASSISELASTGELNATAQEIVHDWDSRLLCNNLLITSLQGETDGETRVGVSCRAVVLLILTLSSKGASRGTRPGTEVLSGNFRTP